MHAPSSQPPQRVCPHCSTLARTTEARCPFCAGRYRRRSALPAAAAVALAAVALTLGGVALMLTAFGDTLDRELDEQVEIVQRDIDRDIRRLERRVTDELDRRLPAAP